MTYDGEFDDELADTMELVRMMAGKPPRPEPGEGASVVERRRARRREAWPKELNHSELCTWRFGGDCDCKLLAQLEKERYG